MPKPFNKRNEEAWEKIKDQMIALEDAMEKKGVFAVGNTNSLFKLYQTDGRAGVLNSIDQFTDYVRSDIKFSLENNKINEKQAADFEVAINKWQTNCKKIITENLTDKPRYQKAVNSQEKTQEEKKPMGHNFRQFGVGSHRDTSNKVNKTKPFPSDSEKGPGH